jgi:hypothetical protein
MTTGALIFAQNNSSIDYNKLAVFAANRINHYLDIPVSVVTDCKDWLLSSHPAHPFDQIIEVPVVSGTKKNFYDGTFAVQQLEWKNTFRSSAYSVTPYETTLVIDSDYIISSDILKAALSREYDFQIYKSSFSLVPWRDVGHYQRINPYSVPFYWATAFIFRKNQIIESFFNLIEYIKHNWSYFRTLYSIDVPIFRNDYAFSIAIHIMNGKTNGEFATELPGVMSYITDKDILVTIKDGDMQFLVEKELYPGEYLMAKTTNLDMHVMNKTSLSRFIDGGSGV